MDRQKRRISTLDGIRGLSALMVVGHHVMLLNPRAVFALELFFALSGFLISGILLDQLRDRGKINILGFYLSRCARLLPAVGVVYVIYLAIALFVPGVAPLYPWDVPGVLLLTNVRNQLGTNEFVYLANVWTLSIEWQFYLAWPLMLIAAWRAANVLMTTAILCVVGIASVWTARLGFGVDVRIDSILMGSLLAVSLRMPSVQKRISPAKAGTFATGSTVMFLLFCFAPFDVKAWMFPLIVVCSGLLVVSASMASDGLARVIFSTSPLRYFGTISYGFYLFHWPIVCAIHQFYGDSIIAKVWAVPISAALAHASWRWIEQPILRRYKGTSGPVKRDLERLPVDHDGKEPVGLRREILTAS